VGSSYKDLLVWQKGIDFVDHVYSATATFPKNEVFGLASQMRRAAVSVASNIAEGSARHSRRDFRRFLRQSRGSIAEIETQVIISARRKYVSPREERQLLSESAEVDRMLSGLISSLEKDIAVEETLEVTTRDDD
jgi:four helix bundle protein